MLEYNDKLGQDIRVGDWIAYPVKHSTSAPLEFAKVTQLGTYLAWDYRERGYTDYPQLLVTKQGGKKTAVRSFKNSVRLGPQQKALLEM